MARKLGRDGYTLLEVVVALLLSAIMITSVMAVALTARTSSGKADRKTLVAQETRRLSGDLKGFVTAFYDYNAGNFIANAGVIAGPATPGTPGPDSWKWTMMPGADGTTNVVDSCGSCYALSLGNHVLTNYLPPWFEAAPYNARASYNVGANGGIGGGQLFAPDVTVTIDWTDP